MEAAPNMPSERIPEARGDDLGDDVLREDVPAGVRHALGTLGQRLAELLDAERDPAARHVLLRVEQERLWILDRTLADLEQAPPGAASQRLQRNAVALPDALCEPPREGTSEALGCWLVTFIDRLVALVERSAARSESPEARETLARLGLLLRGHGRRIARTAYDRCDLELGRVDPGASTT